MMVEERRTNVIASQGVDRANYSGSIASHLSALYEIIRSNPAPKYRKDAVIHLLKLVEEGQEVDNGEIKELFDSETDITVATELKRLLNKLIIRSKFSDDPTCKFDRKLSTEEEAKIQDAIAKLRNLYDKSKGTNGAFDTKYKTIGVIAHGGMGRICKAIRLEDKQIVAIKFLLLEELSKDNDPARIITRFKREGEILNRLNHRNVVKAFEHGEAEEEYFIVMEYLEGETLEKRLQTKPLDFEAFKAICLELCDAVQYLHEDGIIHRDIKPGNIMLKGGNSRLQVKLFDFGLAKDKRDKKLSKFAFSAGTDDYISPQQTKDARDADERDDIYSMGKTFYEMLTGRTLRNDEPYVEIYIRDDATPANINEVIKKCICFERKARWQTVKELKSALQSPFTRKG